MRGSDPSRRTAVSCVRIVAGESVKILEQKIVFEIVSDKKIRFQRVRVKLAYGKVVIFFVKKLSTDLYIVTRNDLPLWEKKVAMHRRQGFFGFGRTFNVIEN